MHTTRVLVVVGILFAPVFSRERALVPVGDGRLGLGLGEVTPEITGWTES